MSIGDEIPFRRSKHKRETGSLVFDQERNAAIKGAKDGESETGGERREQAKR